jgi:dihydrofolate synthase/folylpolyglutamate synthase
VAGALRAAPAPGRTIAVVGMLADKDAPAFGAALNDGVDLWIAVSLPPPRGLEAAALARRLVPRVRAPIEEAGAVAQGCARAKALARPGDRVVVCGSFHAVGPALEWLGVYCAPRTG